GSIGSVDAVCNHVVVGTVDAQQRPGGRSGMEYRNAVDKRIISSGQTIDYDDVASHGARRHNIHGDALSGAQSIHDAGDGAGAAVRGEVAGKHMDFLAQVQQSCSERSCSENDGIGAASSVGRVNRRQLSITVGLQEDVAHALDVNGSV